MGIYDETKTPRTRASLKPYALLRGCLAQSTGSIAMKGRRPGQSGFTLVELMIVVIILGVLAGIAYPAYKSHMMKTRRADARGVMLAIAAQQERFFTECNWYATTLAGTRGCGADNTAGVLGFGLSGSVVDNYTFALTAGGKFRDGTLPAACSDASCGFTLEATPKSTQVNDGKLMINSRGERFWDKNNNGNYLDAEEDSWKK